MSDILIKNMELPKGNDYLHLIIQGGKVHTAISCGHLTTDKLNVADAIEVKPHGRLTDADKLADEYMRYLIYCFPSMQVSTVNELVSAVKEAVKIAPTVLEASE